MFTMKRGEREKEKDKMEQQYHITFYDWIDAANSVP